MLDADRGALTRARIACRRWCTPRRDPRPRAGRHRVVRRAATRCRSVRPAATRGRPVGPTPVRSHRRACRRRTPRPSRAPACAEHDPPEAGGRLLGRSGIRPPARLLVGPVLGDVCEQLRPTLGVAVRLRELHDGAVRLGRHEERFFPLRIGDVDVHRVETRAADALERGGEVGHLEREVMRAGSVLRHKSLRGSRCDRPPRARATRPACPRRRRCRATPAWGGNRVDWPPKITRPPSGPVRNRSASDVSSAASATWSRSYAWVTEAGGYVACERTR